ncbi:proton-dependent oligopeptide transporter family [Artemisia annua]|uniref:Proton-dependent oligopeptide transporter family n=1 Tax=Artemisia annua TaxID=35608 RepID=A0A2U1L0L0_ARTAN|nr:proton-dependent oligopeptide transporter family [Artemisia annua]
MPIDVIVVIVALLVQALVLLALSTLLSTNFGNTVNISSCSPQLQFHTNNLEERKAKSSFLNWWYLGLCSGSTLGIFTVSYIQDNLSWGLGFANNWRTTTSAVSAKQKACGTLPHQEFQKFGIDDVEEAKAVLRLFPVWFSLLGFSIVFAKTSTLYTKQAATLDRSIGSSSRAITNKPSAGNWNWHRLIYSFNDDPSATIPMKVWWLLPQCLLAGAGDVLTIVASFLSNFLISIVEKMTSGNGQVGWISDNVNKGHIDYFYYLLAGISAADDLHICSEMLYILEEEPCDVAESCTWVASADGVLEINEVQ